MTVYTSKNKKCLDDYFYSLNTNKTKNVDIYIIINHTILIIFYAIAIARFKNRKLYISHINAIIR